MTIFGHRSSTTIACEGLYRGLVAACQAVMPFAAGGQVIMMQGSDW